MKHTFTSTSTLVLMMTIAIFVICTLESTAATYTIGAGEDYESPNALYQANVLVDSDTILIQAQEFKASAALAVWQQNDLVIRGINGMPHMIADGQNIWGKGIWVLAGNNITVENIEFSGAMVPDNNGAGIRLDGSGLTIRSCYFHHCEMGILTNSTYEGDILVEYSEFAYNGFGDGFSHNIYVNHSVNFTFQYNYSHHSNIGHCVKSRADNNYILYNRIEDGETGNSSRLIDLPNGGFSLIMGNQLTQGVQAENINLIGYGLEGLINEVDHAIYIFNNTFHNTKTTNGLFLHIQDGTEQSWVVNNIFTGIGTLVNGPNNVTSTNIINEDPNYFAFEDYENFDYHLTEMSPGIGTGTISDAGFGEIIPEFEYLHPTNKKTRDIDPVLQNIDIGAYQSKMVVLTGFEAESHFRIYPNPTTDFIYIDQKYAGQEILVFKANGELEMKVKYDGKRLDLRNLTSGYHILKIEGNSASKAIIKK